MRNKIDYQFVPVRSSVLLNSNWEAFGKDRPAYVTAWVLASAYAHGGCPSVSARDLKTSNKVLEALAAVGLGSFDGRHFRVNRDAEEIGSAMAQPRLSHDSTIVEPRLSHDSATPVLNDSADLAETERKKEREREATTQKTAHSSAIADIFSYWQIKMGRQATKLTTDRRSKLHARLRDGRSVEELKLAIDGCLLSEWHMGSNDRQTVYNDIVTIFKNDAAVQQHIDRARAHGASAAPAARPVEWYETPEYLDAERWFDTIYPPHDRPPLRLRVLRYIAKEQFDKHGGTNDPRATGTLIPIERIDLAQRAREVEPIVRQLG